MFLPYNYWLNFSPVSLTSDETHVWYISLEVPDNELSYFEDILNEEEKQRAARFHFAKHRKYFTVARAVVRILLGGYLNKRAKDVTFSFGKHGKPFVQDLYFNISHSQDKALFGVNLCHDIGIDIEFMRENVSWENIATRYFSKREIAELSQIPQIRKKLAFFRGWTRKEAYIKAIGDGLTMPLSAFHVPLWDTKNLNIHHGTSEKWGLWDLDVGDEYAGAIVLKTLHLHLRKYTDG